MAASAEQYSAATTSPPRTGLTRRASAGSRRARPRARASRPLANASITARSLPSRATVSDPLGRKPTSGKRYPICSHRTRARRARSSSGPRARPLTQIRPKLRTDAPRGAGSRSRWTTSKPRSRAASACMVPRIPPPTTTIRAGSIWGSSRHRRPRGHPWSARPGTTPLGRDRAGRDAGWLCWIGVSPVPLRGTILQADSEGRRRRMADADVQPSSRRLADRYQQVRALTEELAAPALPRGPDRPVDARRQPDQVASGPHLVVLRDLPAAARLAGYAPVPPGVRLHLQLVLRDGRAPGTRGAERGLISRPGVAEVRPTGVHVDEAMAALLESGAADAGRSASSSSGLHHEQQHQELLLMDIKHVLSRNPLRPAYRPDAEPRCPASRQDRGWIEHAGGTVEIGPRRRRLRLRQRVPRATRSSSPRSPWPTGR